MGQSTWGLTIEQEEKRRKLVHPFSICSGRDMTLSDYFLSLTVRDVARLEFFLMKTFSPLCWQNEKNFLTYIQGDVERRINNYKPNTQKEQFNESSEKQFTDTPNGEMNVQLQAATRLELVSIRLILVPSIHS